MKKLSKSNTLIIGFLAIIFLFVFIVKIQDKKKESDAHTSQLLAEYNKEVSKTNAINLIDLEYNKYLYHGIGDTEVNMKINNNSDKDIAYIKIVLYEIDKSGKIIQSDWTNSGNIISGASQTIDTYFNFNLEFSIENGSTLKCEIDEVRFK